MKSQEIKPCPFCGESANLKQLSKHGPHNQLFMVGCPHCGFSLATGPVGIGWFNSASNAISAWNTRDEGASMSKLTKRQLEVLGDIYYGRRPKGTGKTLDSLAKRGLVWLNVPLGWSITSAGISVMRRGQV